MYGVGFGVAVFYERQYQSLDWRNSKIAVPLSFLYGLYMAELQSMKLRFFICQTVFDILDYRKKSRKSKVERKKTSPIHPKQLSKKHRLVYRIYENEVYIEILTAYGHYDDK